MKKQKLLNRAVVIICVGVLLLVATQIYLMSGPRSGQRPSDKRIKRKEKIHFARFVVENGGSRDTSTRETITETPREEEERSGNRTLYNITSQTRPAQNTLLRYAHRGTTSQVASSTTTSDSEGHVAQVDGKNFQYLMDVYLSKYEDLRHKQVMKTYPVHRSCKDEKKPAVPCNDTECPTYLSTDQESNLKSVFPVTSDKRNPLAEGAKKLPSSLLTVVTAVSANHYLESQAMIETLHRYVFPKFQNISFYLYDLGLHPGQKAQMQRHCRCTVIEFPFSAMETNRSDIHCYTWKPLIVQAHLPQTDVLVWADSSVRFNDSATDQLFAPVLDTGFLITLSDRYGRPVAHNTASDTFRYFGMDPCSVANFQEMEASFMAFHNEPFIEHVLVSSWASCALDPLCMCPRGSLGMLHCDGGLRKYAKCHRFDQSAITLITLALFQNHYSTFFFNHSYFQINRGHKSKYFHFLETNVDKKI
ncbi:uncharacterized protein LOC101856720 [Aplysia californica]|uniref:Uncharacterized protein LOC101856720 n=1 Tax=Aplysia californica TaxID=6500 RepID=A0ABM0JH08_APLCA|nr:uncharacterized protein LOC101856720 [Aplysia californica]